MATNNDVAGVSSLQTQEPTGNNMFVSNGYQTHGVTQQKKPVEPVEVENDLIASFQTDPLWSALIHVCIRRGYIHVKPPMEAAK